MAQTSDSSLVDNEGMADLCHSFSDCHDLDPSPCHTQGSTCKFPPIPDHLASFLAPRARRR